MILSELATLSNWLPRQLALGLLCQQEYEFKVSFKERLSAISKCSIYNETSFHYRSFPINTMKADPSKQS